MPPDSTPAAPPPARASGTLGEIVLFGVPVRFHFTFLLLAALVVAAVWSGERGFASDALFLIALLISVLLHELGHVLAARRFGIRTVEIVMYPVGGVSRFEREPGPAPELWVSLAGPAVNIAIGAAAWVAQRLLLARDPVSATMVGHIGLGNLYLAAFNLLPAYPMDGGRVLRAALALRRPEEDATRIAARVGRFIALAMAITGIFLGELIWLVVALMIFTGATQAAAASEGRALTTGVPVRAAMVTDFRALAHGATLREAADLVLATSQQDFPVLHGDHVVGLLDRSDFLRGVVSQPGETSISGLMRRDYLRLHPAQDLAAVLPRMAEAGSCALVMEDDETLVGLLTRENISEFLLLRKLGHLGGAAPTRGAAA